MHIWSQNPCFYGVMIKLIAWAVFQIGPHDPRDWGDWPVGASSKTQFIDLLACFVRPYWQCNHPACSMLRAKLPGSNLFSQDCSGKGFVALSCSFYLSIALPLYIPTFLSVDLSQLHVRMIGYEAVIQGSRYYGVMFQCLMLRRDGILELNLGLLLGPSSKNM